MKRLFSAIILATLCISASAYNDHRNHNVDSLETVVAKWSAPTIAKASEEELMQLSRDWRDLMLGYLNTNVTKSEYYARQALRLGQKKGWELTIWDSAKVIGQHFWAKNQFDSAAVYYTMAMEAVQKMEVVDEDSVVIGVNYSALEKDDCLSSLYGTLGNLYSDMDSTALAMDYYGKALEIFKSYGWTTSCAVCYANMGETVLLKGRLSEAEGYFEKELEYAKESKDSLWIADAWKRFGKLYLERGETMKALEALDKADSYFSLHEDEEMLSRLEILDFTGQVLRLQKKQLQWFLYGAIAIAVLLLIILVLGFYFHRIRKAKKIAETVLEETIEELRPARVTSKREIPALTERETQILRLIAEGKTNPQIADAVFLSPETIKWYRKKLLVKFDATNSADLIRLAMEMGLI